MKTETVPGKPARMLTYLAIASLVLGIAGAAMYWSSTPALASPGVGEAAPGFEMLDQHGNTHKLEDYAGKWLVLYFYPKNDTPGCTTEACNFRDDIFAFREMGVEIAGVSLDDIESHQEFAEKYSLPFTLLSDADKTTSGRYGVLAKMGPFEYARRETFIIDPDGRIAKHYGDVDPEEHSAEVIADLQRMLTASAD